MRAAQEWVWPTARTRAAYQADWDRFVRWCEGQQVVPLPAEASTVAAYLRAARAGTDGRPPRAPGTLRRWRTSINHAHVVAGFPAPGPSTGLRPATATAAGSTASAATGAAATDRRARRAAPTPEPPGVDDYRTALGALTKETGWPAAVSARRDAAILLIGVFGGLSRDDLVALTVDAVTLDPVEGLRVRLARSRRDPAAGPAVRTLPFTTDPVTCPPCAWTRWRSLLDAADADPAGSRPAMLSALYRDLDGGHVCRVVPGAPTAGRPAPDERPLFRAVDRAGRLSTAALSGEAVRLLLRRRAAEAGVAGPAWRPRSGTY